MRSRNGELTHSVLMAMLDAYCTSLDLSGCATLKPSTLLAVLPKLPQLAALDLTACRVTNYVLQAIPQCCPHLQVLRLGGDAACDTHRHVWAALIPVTDDAVDSSCLDNWESLEDAGQASCRCIPAACLLSHSRALSAVAPYHEPGCQSLSGMDQRIISERLLSQCCIFFNSPGNM